MSGIRRYRRLLLVGLCVVAGTIGAIVLAVEMLPEGPLQSGDPAEVWTCSMHPQIRLPAPGRCPICGMALIRISDLAAAARDLRNRAGLETETIQFRELGKEVRTVGKLDFSERQVELITARFPGRVDRLYVDFTGIKVKKNDHLVELYSPDLYTAQSELIHALQAVEASQKGSQRLPDRFVERNLEAAREKLGLLGLLPEQISEIEKNRRELAHVTVYAPLGGTVIEKNVRLGQYVKEGDPLYRIASLDPIWLYLDIYESDIGWIRFGQPARVTFEAFPGETFRGTVAFIAPFLDDATRTIRVRVNLKNPDERLKPQMYATAVVHVALRADGLPQATGLEGKYVCPMHPEIVQVAPGKCSICEMPLEQVPELPQIVPRPQGPGAAPSQSRGLAIPVSAVLDTGRRQIAYRLTSDGAYELVELKLGPRAVWTDAAGRNRDYFVVLDGLAVGDQVVVQGGFLLDSQRQIEGMPSLLYPVGQTGEMIGHAGHGAHKSTGSVSNRTSISDENSPAIEVPAGHQH